MIHDAGDQQGGDGVEYAEPIQQAVLGTAAETVGEQEKDNGQDLFTQLGIPLEQLTETLCGKTGLYLHRMNDPMAELVQEVWRNREEADFGSLRYLMVRLLHELMTMPQNCWSPRTGR